MRGERRQNGKRDKGRNVLVLQKQIPPCQLDQLPLKSVVILIRDLLVYTSGRFTNLEILPYPHRGRSETAAASLLDFARLLLAN